MIHVVTLYLIEIELIFILKKGKMKVYMDDLPTIVEMTNWYLYKQENMPLDKEK